LLPINRDVLPYGPDGIDFPFYNDMYWVCVVGTILGFIAAMGIGANDVANSFATSVGSKTITVFQAMIIAGIFEFSGAVGLGSGTTDTIRKKIVNIDVFESRPDVLMIGMLCSIAATAIWLIVASMMGLPVSTTHSTIGAIIGFALCMPNGGDILDICRKGILLQYGCLGSCSWSYRYCFSYLLHSRTNLHSKKRGFFSTHSNFLSSYCGHYQICCFVFGYEQSRFR